MTFSAQTQPSTQTPRRVFIILSAKALPYAERCVDSLFNNSLEALDVKLITDSPEDKQAIVQTVMRLENPQQHKWQVIDQPEADAQAEEQFHQFEHLKQFRFGHPCWRKLTDPLLFTRDGEEMIILDPDLYFPNQFAFETTPEKSLLLMWQRPSCLLPPESVRAAFSVSKLAHHVDIGVAQIRKPLDLEWFNWFVGQLGGKDIPRFMHVEAIVWSAMAMKFGGGYLDPTRWHCWHRTQLKRILIKLGIPGTQILKLDNLGAAKCFHACGVSKWWVKEACDKGVLTGINNDLSQPSRVTPFVEYTRDQYESEQRFKGWLRKLGYYRLFGSN